MTADHFFLSLPPGPGTAILLPSATTGQAGQASPSVKGTSRIFVQFQGSYFLSLYIIFFGLPAFKFASFFLVEPRREGAGRAGWGSVPSGLRDAAAGRGRALLPGQGQTPPAELAQPATPEGPAPPRPPSGRRGGAQPAGCKPSAAARPCRLPGRIRLSAFKDGISWAWHEPQRQ